MQPFELSQWLLGFHHDFPATLPIEKSMHMAYGQSPITGRSLGKILFLWPWYDQFKVG